MLELDRPAAELLAAIDFERARLRELLTGRDEAKLAQRPPSGQWSVREHLQHLLFTGQGHLREVTPGRVQFSPLGLANEGLTRKFPILGTVQPKSVGEVLGAWDAAHARVVLGGRDDAAARKALAGNLRHLRDHMTIIEHLIRRTGA